MHIYIYISMYVYMPFTSPKRRTSNSCLADAATACLSAMLTQTGRADDIQSYIDCRGMENANGFSVCPWLPPIIPPVCAASSLTHPCSAKNVAVEWIASEGERVTVKGATETDRTYRLHRRGTSITAASNMFTQAAKLFPVSTICSNGQTDSLI